LTCDPTAKRRVPGQKRDPLLYQVSPTPSVGYTDGLGQGWSVLATDGITDFVGDNEACDIASGGLTRAAACAALVARAKEKRTEDNVTAMIVRNVGL
jgi:serine/threonine protein phosphatase PrpC